LGDAGEAQSERIREAEDQKLGMRSGSLPERLSVIPTGPINTRILAAALYRFADSLTAGDGRFAALEALLRTERPSIQGLAAGESLVGAERNATAQVTDVLSRLQESYLFIQGPPGAGKTYTGSHVIVALLQRGARVAVSSNSHKAINNLLAAVERRAADQQVQFRGVKKATKEETFLNMHVDLLTQTLPTGARVGTIDKFQGQEAEVVIVSLATSSGDDLPRYLEFLYSKNRLNVALSRARSLALLVANPRLMAMAMRHIDQAVQPEVVDLPLQQGADPGLGDVQLTQKQSSGRNNRLLL